MIYQKPKSLSEAVRGHRDRALTDFWFFCEEVLKMPMSEKPHREMADFISSGLSANRLLLVPRGCWKTSLGSIAYPFWRVLRAYFLEENPCHRVLVDSATVRLSQQVIRTIGRYARNVPAIKLLFGQVYDRRGDHGEELSFAFRLDAASGIKEPNFLASGIGAEKTGLHFEDIILDDLVTKENYCTPNARQKTYDHYRMMNAIIESGGREGQKTTLTCMGTRYHDADLYGILIKEDKQAIEDGVQPVFTQLRRQSVDTQTGELYYPSVLTREVLEKKKQVMKGLFWAQFQNDPNQESAPFRPEWLKWVPLREFPALSQIRLTVDTALKEDQVSRGDHCAMIVAGWDHFYQLWIMDVTLSNSMTLGAFVNEFFRLLRRWDIELAIVEEDHSLVLRALLEREKVQRGVSTPIFWQKNPKNIQKATRWSALQPYAERGGVRIAEEIPGASKVEIMDEWERAPFATHDDFMDALALHTVRLPIEIEEGTGRVALRSEGERPSEMLERRGKPSKFYFGTLADAFPFIRALEYEAAQAETLPPDPLTQIHAELIESFRDG